MDEIFEELIDYSIPVDTMITPTSVPTTFPTSTTAASASLPSVHVNRAFTPSSVHSKPYKQGQFQSKKNTYNTGFAGCPGCQADAESQLNIMIQVLHHDESTRLLLNNANIRVKSICEAVKQHNAKKSSHYGQPKRELDYQRKSPHLAVMPSPKVKSILLNSDPQVIHYNIHDPPYLTEEDEEDNDD
eukprot:5383523-Ditylum_brightwellii.AAC.1